MIPIFRTIQKRLIAHKAIKRFVSVHGGTVTAAELRQHAEWIASRRAHTEAYAEIDELWIEMERLSAEFARLPLDTNASPPRYPTPLVWGAVSIAATLVLMLAFTWRASDLAPIDRGTPERHATAVAETSEFYLPDRSKLILGAKSEIVVESFGDQRSVALTSGEAYFEVAKDADRPFYVDTGLATIRVVGTKFNVHTGPNGVRVTVAEGRVAVNAKAQNGVNHLDQPQVFVDAGQSILIDQSGNALVHTASNIGDVMSWRHGLLTFTNTPLSTVAADLNRYSRETLIIEGHELQNVPITGLFRAGELLSVVAELRKILPVEAVEIRPGEFVIRRCQPTVCG
ncbi:MAG: FecR domain-containing protein [Rhodospirillaceae bacterium]|nr:FecR domain-containing protein [Rhodospirillaceae bacterium]